MDTLKRQGVSFLPYYILIFIVSIFFYYKMFSAGFISWDDSDVLLKNNDVHDFNLKAFFSKHYVGNYAPITMMSFAIDWALFYGNSFWHHLVNILLHGINGILVFTLTFSIFKNRYWAIITALVFCLHPLQVETVAWIAAKNNIVYTLFFLLSLLFYVRYIEELTTKNLMLCLLLFILSALSKPSALCLPFCLWAIDLFQKRKFSKKIIFEKIPFLLVSILIGAITIMARSEDKFLNDAHAFAWHERIGYSGYALFCYISSFIAPIHQSVIYPYPSNKSAAIIIGYLVLILLAAIVYFLVKTKRYSLLAIIAFFTFNLVLVLQFFPFGEVLTADRYMYIPIIALSWLVLFLLKPSDAVSKYLAVGLILIMGPLTFLRTSVWKNSIELYADILKKYPTSHVALNSIGAEYMNQNEDNKALSCFNEAISVSPRYHNAYYNRGLIFAKNKRNKEAISDFTKAIELKNYVKAYAARAEMYYQEKEYSKAISDAETALNKDPKSIRASYVLANSYNDLNQLDKALLYYNQALHLSPEEANLYLRRAIVYGKLQQFENSLADLNTCTKIAPEFGEAYYWKGVAKQNLKQDPCTDLQKAVSLNFMAAQGPLTKYCK